MLGKLEKMLILAFKDSQSLESGGVPIDMYEVLINPESYQTKFVVALSGEQTPGSSGAQLKYGYSLPAEMSLEFLFDNTGIIDGKPNPTGVFADITHFQKVIMGYKGTSHETAHLKLIWGTLIFSCRAVELNVTYKLFNSSGVPIRAIANVRFLKSVEEKKRIAQDSNSSPDLTHVRKVKAGDTLPLMCYHIYGDPKYYLQVAAANDLGNFRFLTPGTDLVFPPIAKSVRAS